MPTIVLDPVAPVSHFAANMAILARRCPRLAERLVRTPPRTDLAFFPSDDPAVLSAELGGVALASRRRPAEEGERLTASFDLRKAGGLLVLGFGLGYHVAAAARRLKRAGVVVVFEPDLALLRAVLERVDHSAWMSQFPFLIIDDPDDSGAMSEVIRGYEAPLAVGIEVLEHPASRQRLGASAGTFTESFTRVVSALRTNVITTMVQTDVTLRNVLMNADAYINTPGVDDLAGITAGKPAIVVAAGPSLARTIDQLKTPGLRDRCVIVAVQTVLKQLLAAGIRPHFVTALDYHEISRRFYEGLTSSDVQGVTLIAEPRANPAIIESWPGAMRMTGDKWLEDIIGPEIAGPHAQLKAGATVAHLAYYVARHMGCDPVILTGQDLAFTDGQYYAAGAAIHQVWSSELSMFNTLEMMEWQRIVRMRGNIRRAQDHLGRPVYTDDQMATYLAQFERDFGGDAALGLTTIDATEGGVRKSHTKTMTMREALAQFAAPGSSSIGLQSLGKRTPDPDRVKQGIERMRQLRNDIRRIGRLSRETLGLLGKMKQHHGDEARVNRIIRDVHKLRDEVQSMALPLDLVQRLNQTGSFKRYRADREMMLAESLTPLERQLKQIDRDIVNVQWIVDVTEVFDDLLNAAADACSGTAPRRTRDLAPRELDDHAAGASATPVTRTRVGALLVVPVAGMGRKLAGESTLQRTIDRLLRVRSLDKLVIATDGPEAMQKMVADDRVEVIAADLAPWSLRHERVMAARKWSGASWRGGIAHLTCYDEVLDPGTTSRLMAETQMDAALVVGADWSLVDPSLCEQVIERHRENPGGQPLVFTQAPPGLAGCLISRTLAEELAKGQTEGITFASIGGLLGYIPTGARPDPIVKPCCVPIDPAIRDSCFRYIADDAWTLRELEHVANTLGDRMSECSALELATAMISNVRNSWPGAPRHITMEISRDCVRERIVDALRTATVSPGIVPLVTLLDIDSTAGSAPWTDLVHAIKPFVGGIHVRTRLGSGEAAAEQLNRLPIDVVSVDVLANSPATYQRIHGEDGFARTLNGLERLVRAQGMIGGLPWRWVVPRITRCDAVYEEIEAFFDAWLMLAGAAMIDQLPAPRAGERIEPLGKPSNVAVRDAREHLFVGVDGNVWADERSRTGDPLGKAWTDGVARVWKRLEAHRERWTGW